MCGAVLYWIMQGGTLYQKCLDSIVWQCNAILQNNIVRHIQKNNWPAGCVVPTCSAAGCQNCKNKFVLKRKILWLSTTPRLKKTLPQSQTVKMQTCQNDIHAQPFHSTAAWAQARKGCWACLCLFLKLETAASSLFEWKACLDTLHPLKVHPKEYRSTTHWQAVSDVSHDNHERQPTRVGRWVGVFPSPFQL